MNATVQEQLDKELKDFREVFPRKLPSIVETAYRHSFLESLTPLFRRVYKQSKAIKDRALIESLLTTALYHCDQAYCYIVHSSVLLESGVSTSEIKDLTSLLKLPARVDNRLKWNSVLKLTFSVFSQSYNTMPNVKEAQKMMTADEYNDFTHIIALAYHLKHLVYFYGEELNIEGEIQLLIESEEIRKELKDLVKYYDGSKKRKENPVVCMCMFCKDVRNEDGDWFPIELAIKVLKNDTTFSHSICDRCLELNVLSEEKS